MLHIRNARINTAGAYVCLDGLFVFAIGIRPHNGHIPIVRLGGHRIEDESGWQCAAREVFEEANLRVKVLLPQTTYLYEWDYPETELRIVQWQHATEREPCPYLVVTYCHSEETSLSVMYLAHAEGTPAPSSEVRGLLLPGEAEIHRLCQKPMTLRQYLDRGGRAILKDEFNLDLVLEPFVQLRLLSKLLTLQPEPFFNA